ncbi:MAG TPA: hypothetical protein VF533_06825 [Solirubrobacteraceae bacterium]|jgi:hypothetical protein
MPEPSATTRDALETIRAQVDAAHGAAERLVRDAEEAARRRIADVPARGWASAPPGGPAPEPGPGTTVEALQAILTLLEAVRGAVPPELADQFAGALRELLKAVRALIDHTIERLEPGASATTAAAPRPVEDIPID